FVKAIGMHAVPSPITGTFMPPSNKPDLDDTQDCDFYEKQLELHNKPMWKNVANNPLFVPKATSVPAGSRNRSTSVPAGWKNNDARPMTRPTSHYFQHFSPLGYFNHMNMDEGRWGTALNPSAGCSLRIRRPNMQWGSKNNGGSHQSTWFNS
ncbi:hypothetical protein Tco_1285556, partial [Tanacetum coccineum]